MEKWLHDATKELVSCPKQSDLYNKYDPLVDYVLSDYDLYFVNKCVILTKKCSVGSDKSEIYQHTITEVEKGRASIPSLLRSLYKQ